MNQLLFQFSYLQILDLLSTVAFLALGVREANPLVRLAMAVFPGLISGLIAVKALALLLGIYCWRVRRYRLLSRVNVMFAVIIAWNLIAIILGSVRA